MDDKKYLIGTDGWLFLKNDTNRIIDQITGRYALTDDVIHSWLNLLRLRDAYFKSKGINYSYICAPNKECVYSQYLPSEIEISENRPINIIKDIFEKTLGNRFSYPLMALKNNEFNTFSKGDTHWNHYGAYVAYKIMMAKIGVSRVIERSDIQFIPLSRKGDLISKHDRNSLDEVICASIKIPVDISVEFDNKVVNRGKLTVINNPLALNDESLLIFRDSFGSCLSHFLARTFRRVVMVWQPNIDFGIVEVELPDYVISGQVERFIVSPPNDITDLSNNQLSRSKIKDCKLYYDIP